jgi:DNA polymerase IV
MSPERAIIHVDMDAFYASVEQRDNPSLRGRPVIVGGSSARGVVCAASYEARPFGVRSAMPMRTALQRLPQAVVLAPRMDVYAKVSQAVFEVFERYTPMIEPLSLDEAFLDVTASQTLFGKASEIALSIRNTIARELSLPSSAGIASMKFVAKIASDLAKPDGQRQVAHQDVVAFLAPLPVTRLWGVGTQTKAQCDRLGLKTIGDVAKREQRWLETHFGRQGQRFFELSRGIDSREVVSDRQMKSVSAQETFEEDITDVQALSLQLHAQAMHVARRLRAAGKKGWVVTVSLRDSDFVTRSHQVRLSQPTDDGQTLYKTASALLTRFTEQKPIRMSGLSCSDFDAAANQGLLFEPESARKQRNLNHAIDALAGKYGPSIVKPAALASVKFREPPKSQKAQRQSDAEEPWSDE